MKKTSPRLVHFCLIQALVLASVTALPCHLMRVFRIGEGFDLLLLLLSAGLVMLIDAFCVAGALRRYHHRHPDRSPWLALILWGVYLIAVTLIILIAAGFGLSSNPVQAFEWGFFMTIAFAPWTLLLPVILWLPACLASFLDPYYRYTPRKARQVE